jgi:translation initiation factor 3 subunit A
VGEENINTKKKKKKKKKNNNNNNNNNNNYFLPAIKFLWEIYRAVLDILKSNSKLERLYHACAVSALRFCGEYKRRVEFRRLCDMMRMHLGTIWQDMVV